MKRYESDLSPQAPLLGMKLYTQSQEVLAITEHGLQEYNTTRPHEALQGLTPPQYAIQHA